MFIFQGVAYFHFMAAMALASENHQVFLPEPFQGQTKGEGPGPVWGNYQGWIHGQSAYPHVRYPHDKYHLNKGLLTIVVSLIRPY